MSIPETSPPDLEAARQRATRLFLIAVAAGNTAMVAAMTVTTLVAERITGSAAWSGVPLAAGTLGIAFGTSMLPRIFRRWGRRRGLIAAYGVAAIGAGLAILAATIGWFPLLVVGMFTLGSGQSATTFTRYLSADLEPVERRAAAVGLIVWMGTVGAVLGPNLLAPADHAGQLLGLPPVAGAYGLALLAFAFSALLYFVWLRPDPGTLVWRESAPTEEETSRHQAKLRHYFRDPTIQIALATMLFGHVVMVLIMTMTPLHVQHGGHGLGPIGFIMSAHTLGMFAFSPLVGKLVGRLGAFATIRIGLALLLVAAVLASLTTDAKPGLLLAALFLLGLGWNFGFVAGSSLLAAGVPLRDRSQVQGITDSLVWTSAASASLLSGLIVASAGYQILCWLGAALVLAPAVVLVLRRRGAVGTAPAALVR